MKILVRVRGRSRIWSLRHRYRREAAKTAEDLIGRTLPEQARSHPVEADLDAAGSPIET